MDTCGCRSAASPARRGGVVLARPDALLDPDAEAFDVTYTRGWPSALKMTAGRYALDVTPHAGFGVNNAGGTAEAGAMLRLGADMGDQLMSRLGIQAVGSVELPARGAGTCSPPPAAARSA